MAWENSSAAAVAVAAAAVAHLGFDRIGFDRIGFDRIGFDRIDRFQKNICFFAQKMNQEMIKVPCFQKKTKCQKNESGDD